MKLGVVRNGRRTRQDAVQRGFTLLELIFVLLICIVMTAMAVPMVNNTLTGYRLRGAVSSMTGAIQATRYQAIFNGYQFRIVFTPATLTYQVQSDPNRVGIFANFCPNGGAACPVPLAGSSTPVTLSAGPTFTFSPGGTVTSTTAVTGVTTIVVTYSGKTETINVSSYGNIKVTEP
ncbi:MAG: prepilin-type N-terminal cleavage/methylation domain-containing protein [Candidatus Angelobacter sp.]